MQPMGDLNKEKEYWENAAKTNIFDEIRNGWNKEDFDKRTDDTIVNSIKFDKNDTVLEIGCGIGYTIKIVAPQVKKYIGMDYSQNMLEEAKQYNKQFNNTEYILTPGNSIPLPDKSVDLIYSELVFQHLGNDTAIKYFDEIKRVIKTNGRYYIQMPKLEVYGYGWNKEMLLKHFKEEQIKEENMHISSHYIYVVKEK